MAYNDVSTTVTTANVSEAVTELSAAKAQSVADRRKIIAADDRGNQSTINLDEDIDYGAQVRAINGVNTVRTENLLVQSVMLATPIPRPIYGGSD